jgi:hypothetical protein
VLARTPDPGLRIGDAERGRVVDRLGAGLRGEALRTHFRCYA